MLQSTFDLVFWRTQTLILPSQKLAGKSIARQVGWGKHLSIACLSQQATSFRCMSVHYRCLFCWFANTDKILNWWSQKHNGGNWCVVVVVIVCHDRLICLCCLVPFCTKLGCFFSTRVSAVHSVERLLVVIVTSFFSVNACNAQC